MTKYISLADFAYACGHLQAWTSQLFFLLYSSPSYTHTHIDMKNLHQNACVPKYRSTLIQHGVLVSRRAQVHASKDTHTHACTTAQHHHPIRRACYPDIRLRHLREAVPQHQSDPQQKTASRTSPLASCASNTELLATSFVERYVRSGWRQRRRGQCDSEFSFMVAVLAFSA